MDMPDIPQELWKDARVVRVAVTTALKVASELELSDSELCHLLDVTESVLETWKEEPPSVLAEDTLRRISHLLNIYGALHQIYASAGSERPARWLRTANSVFGERSALERMLEGVTGLASVHYYLRSH